MNLQPKLPKKLLSQSVKFVSPLLLVAALFGCSSNPQQDLAAGRDNYFQQNYQASFERIKKAAAAGDPDAEYALGYMYYYGKGTDQDVELARSWIQKSAAQGQPMAAKALALMDSEQVQANVGMNPTQVRQQTAAKTNARAIGKNYAVNRKPEDRRIYANPVMPIETTANGAPVSPSPAANKTGASSVPYANAAPMRATSAVAATGYGQQLLAGNGYTIQIMSSDKQSSVTNFMRAHNLDGKAFSYRKNFKGKELHVLVYGDYKSSAEAHQALKALPQALRANKPWIKSVAQVKSEMIG